MKNETATKKSLRHFIKTAAVILIWVCIWFILSKAAGTELLVPSPRAVLDAFLSLLCEKEYYLSCLNSLSKIVSGWLIGCISGLFLAVITRLSRFLNALFEPVLHIIKATPVASFIVLALVLMSSGKVPVFTCALITVPFVWANTFRGLSSPDEKLVETAEFFGMKRTKKIRNIYIPSAMPYFTTAVKTSMGLSWKAGIAAEVICSPKNSIGAEIYNAKIYLETPSLFAWTLTVILLSVLLEKLLGLLLKVAEEKK